MSLRCDDGIADASRSHLQHDVIIVDMNDAGRLQIRDVKTTSQVLVRRVPLTSLGSALLALSFLAYDKRMGVVEVSSHIISIIHHHPVITHI